LFVTGTFSAPNEAALLRILAHLGSRIVFLIDWNHMRKRLRGFVDKTRAIEVLKWAAERPLATRMEYESIADPNRCLLPADLLMAAVAASAYRRCGRSDPGTGPQDQCSGGRVVPLRTLAVQKCWGHGGWSSACAGSSAAPSPIDAWLQERGVTLIGADLDESPMAYRRPRPGG
jgi:hypothetical protein